MLVSACLLGHRCRWDGGENRDLELERVLGERGEIPVPCCPEEAGGLSTPRPPAWIEARGAAAVLDGAAQVVTEGGIDATQAFLAGADGALATCRARGITRADLKERSPSCGVRQTHVGGELVDGPGVCAERLAREGIEVLGGDGGRRAGEAGG